MLSLGFPGGEYIERECGKSFNPVSVDWIYSRQLQQSNQGGPSRVLIGTHLRCNASSVQRCSELAGPWKTLKVTTADSPGVQITPDMMGSIFLPTWMRPNLKFLVSKEF